MKAAEGQIWASTDPRDVAKGHRQARMVTSVMNGYAYLRTEGSKFNGSHGTRLLADGSIPRHRYVGVLDPVKRDEARARADALEVEAEELHQQALQAQARADRIRESWNLPA